MAEQIPNLWRANEEAVSLYALFLTRLEMYGRHERILSASRQIRRYAARGPGGAEGLFTFFFEIEALCALKQYDRAWKQLRKREEILFGARLNLARHKWPPDHELDLPFYYAPILYFRSRYRLGCTLLETWLESQFRRKKVGSYDLLFYVYKGDQEPTDRHGVSLFHFYAHLGRNLRDWRRWKTLVNGFPPRLFEVAEVSREDLLRDPSCLAIFFDNLMAVLAERGIPGVSTGLANLIDDQARVGKRKRTTAHGRPHFAPQKRFEAKLLKLFPATARVAGLNKGFDKAVRRFSSEPERQRRATSETRAGAQARTLPQFGPRTV